MREAVRQHAGALLGLAAKALGLTMPPSLLLRADHTVR
jgi:hypothetical protein